MTISDWNPLPHCWILLLQLAHCGRRSNLQALCLTCPAGLTSLLLHLSVWRQWMSLTTRRRQQLHHSKQEELPREAEVSLICCAQEAFCCSCKSGVLLALGDGICRVAVEAVQGHAAGLVAEQWRKAHAVVLSASSMQCIAWVGVAALLATLSCAGMCGP